MKRILHILEKKPLLLMMIAGMLLYLPVWLPFFHLKNDVLSQNLPTRFIFGESLYEGFLPFWNPFLHYGTPQYGDMNNGFWNPLQWLVGITTGHSIYSITAETYIYLVAGGFGIYLLCREFTDRRIALWTGIAYMCCGTTVGHLQYFIWITGMGYFPYVVLFYLRSIRTPTVKNFLAGGISLFLFVASTHPGLVIGALYFFFFLVILLYVFRNDKMQRYFPLHFWKATIVFLLTGLAFSAVVVASNLEVLAHISRGTKVSWQESQMAPTTWASYLSLFAPLTVHAAHYTDTDIAMRNIFIGLPQLAGLLLFFRWASGKMRAALLVPLLFFMFLAAGGWFKTFAWRYLPLLGYVRLSGEFAYFVTFIMLLAGAAGLNHWNSLLRSSQKTFTRWAIGLSVAGLIVALTAILLGHRSIFSVWPDHGVGAKTLIREILHRISWQDLLLAQCIINLIILVPAYVQQERKSIFPLLLFMHMLLINWLCLPFTGLGMRSLASIDRAMHRYPRGFEIPQLVPLEKAFYSALPEREAFQLVSSYSKRIGGPVIDQYPVVLRSHQAFLRDTALFDFIQKRPYLFLSADTISMAGVDTTSRVEVYEFGPGYLRCRVESATAQWLTFLQNNYPGWTVKCNGSPVPVYTGFKTFLSVPVNKGITEVEFRFWPKQVIPWMFMSLTLIMLAAGMLMIPSVAGRRVFRSSSPSGPD